MPTFVAPAPKGMIKDTNNTVLPPEFYSHASNIRFTDMQERRSKDMMQYLSYLQ